MFVLDFSGGEEKKYHFSSSMMFELTSTHKRVADNTTPFAMHFVLSKRPLDGWGKLAWPSKSSYFSSPS